MGSQAKGHIFVLRPHNQRSIGKLIAYHCKKERILLHSGPDSSRVAKSDDFGHLVVSDLE